MLSLNKFEKPRSFIYEKTADEKHLKQTVNRLEHNKKTAFELKKPQAVDFAVLLQRATKIIKIPFGVQIQIKETEKGKILFVKGARGLLFHQFTDQIRVDRTEEALLLSYKKNEDLSAFRSQLKIVYNMIIGVTRGYKEKIKTVGVGYRGNFETKQLISFSLGYSHKVYHLLPPTAEIEFSRKNNKMNLFGASLPIVSSSAAALHRAKSPDVYNGKGIRYRGLKLRKKVGKKQSR
jgi:large subunit ribosomal protein L6